MFNFDSSVFNVDLIFKKLHEPHLCKEVCSKPLQPDMLVEAVESSCVVHACLLTSPVYLPGLGAHRVPALPLPQCSVRHLHVSSCGGANHHFYEVHYGRGWHDDR